MALSRTSEITSDRIKESAGPTAIISEKAIAAVVAERARFHRFIAAHIGDDTTADAILRKSLSAALKQSPKVHRGEPAVSWFYRVCHNALTDYYTNLASDNRRIGRLLAEMQARDADTSAPPPDWNGEIRTCFRGLLPSLEPRYAQVISRVDLHGESKRDVAREMKLSAATMDVLLHRARQALRRRLEIFCGSSSRESCLACFGRP